MYNNIILLGNLTRDIELRYLPNGSAVANTAIATSKKFKKQDGNVSEEVCFCDLTFFGRSAEIANQYLKKGSKVLIDGRLKFDQWTDNNGNKRSKHSVVVEVMQMLDSKPQQPQPQETEYYYGDQKVQPQQKPPDAPMVDVSDDEIPF